MFPEVNLGFAKLALFPLCAGVGVASVVSCVFIGMKRLRLDAETQEKITEFIPFTLLAGFLSGVLSDVFFRVGLREAVVNPGKMGMTFFGALLGCMFALAVYARVRCLSVGLLMNLFLPSFALAQAFGRIGCFCGGCCFGRPLEGCWCGVVYPEGSLPFLKFGFACLAPVQLFEASYLLAAFLALMLFVGFRFRAAAYLVAVGAGRFLLEFLRGDDRGSLFGLTALSPAQVIGAALIVAGGVSLLWLFSHSKNEKEVLRCLGGAPLHVDDLEDGGKGQGRARDQQSLRQADEGGSKARLVARP